MPGIDGVHLGMRRQAWPLAMSLAAHLVLGLIWLGNSHRPRMIEAEPRRLLVLLIPKAAPVPQPALRPARSERREPNAPQRTAQTAAPRQAQPENQRPAAEVPVREPLAITPVQPSAGAIMESARRDVGKIDRALRGSKLDVPARPDNAWRRLEQGIAAAAPNDNTLKEDSYTSPDGVVTYRRRMGGKMVCRKTGSVGPPAPWRSEGAILAGAGRASTLGVGGEAGDYLCPESDPGWKKR
jgi:hypothetical protein